MDETKFCLQGIMKIIGTYATNTLVKKRVFVQMAVPGGHIQTPFSRLFCMDSDLSFPKPADLG